MRLRFYGHACFGIQAAETHLCIDPFDPTTLGGAFDLAPPPDVFTHWLATHDHVDHAAGHVVPKAQQIQPAAEVGPIHVDAIQAAHDEFGGRLRGGLVSVLRMQVKTPNGPRVIVHCGDLGERPTGRLLDWLCSTPVDILIAPVGGYFTLGPDGAAELAGLVAPTIVVPCHAREHGCTLPQLGSVAPFERHMVRAGYRIEDNASALRLDALPATPTVVPMVAPAFTPRR